MSGLARCSSSIRRLTLLLPLAAWLVAQAATSLSISTTSPLPTGALGQAYSATLTASGGTAPYTFAITSGALPTGVSFNTAGTIAGTPTVSGIFTLVVQVSDAAKSTASGTFKMIINAVPVSITTVSPLFTGTVGQSYSQSFAATGGTAPYTWRILSGDTGGLTLDGTTGILSGTPSQAGVFTFTMQATDSVGGTAAQAFSITVNAPVLTLAVVSSLPAGTVGTAYSQKLPVTASGGTTPYTWTLSGSVPGLSFDATALTLSGTPTTTGSYTLTVQVADAGGNIAKRTLPLTISPAALSITTARQLPSAALSGTYSQTVAATGGVPPYSWSATGLPGGLSINTATGLISGTLTAAGSFSVVITVTDSVLTSYKDLFSLSVSYPTTPAISFSGLPAAASPAQQYSLQISLGSTYPVDISGQAILSFSPDSGPTDGTVQFASGGTTASFAVPAGSTKPPSTASLALQTGTVSGTLTVTLRFLAAGVDITPSPAPTVTTQIARAAPVINGLQVSRTSSTLSVVVTGYATAREVTQAVFTFTAATGQTLQSAASSITVDVSTLFGNWFQDSGNSQYGTQFIFTQPFTITGDPTAVTPVSVTLTNRLGSVTSKF